MSSEQGTSSSSGKGMDKNKGMSPVQSAAVTGSTQYAGMSVTQGQTEAGKDYVKKKLGLTATIANPNEAATQSNTTGYYSTTGNQMYGGAASQATNDYLVSIGEATQNPSGSYTLTAKGWKMKYGSYTPGQAQTGAAMGTGNPAGIMTSTPISQPMWKQQQKTKGILLGAMSLATSGFTAMGMRAAAFDAFNKAQNSQSSYSDYLGKFNINQNKDVSSSGIKSGNVDTSGSEVSSTGMINTSVTGDNTQKTKFKKKKAGQGTDTLASTRSLFKKSNKTITGYMAT